MGQLDNRRHRRRRQNIGETGTVRCHDHFGIGGERELLGRRKPPHQYRFESESLQQFGQRRGIADAPVSRFTAGELEPSATMCGRFPVTLKESLLKELKIARRHTAEPAMRQGWNPQPVNLVQPWTNNPQPIAWKTEKREHFQHGRRQ